MNVDMFPKSPRDAVEKWDRGMPVWTVELGGLGPGYEQSIQISVIEILREFLDDTNIDNYEKRADVVLHRIDDDVLGLSGAQAAMAKRLARKFLIDGWKAVHDELKEDKRWIQVSKHWPKAPEPKQYVKVTR